MIILLEGFHAFVYFGGGGHIVTPYASFYLKVFKSSFLMTSSSWWRKGGGGGVYDARCVHEGCRQGSGEVQLGTGRILVVAAS